MAFLLAGMGLSCTSTGPVKASRIDSPALWSIERDPSQPQARAVGRRGARIADLAQEIGLDPEESDRWLSPPRPEDYAVEGEREAFRIPNTVFASWGGHYALGIGKGWVHWSELLAALRARGYYIIESERYTGADVGAMMRTLSAQRKLHGFVFWGHSGKNSLLTAAAHWLRRQKNSPWIYSYSNWESDLSYRLGLGWAFGCDSGALDPRRDRWHIFSPNAQFFGSAGKMAPAYFFCVANTIDATPKRLWAPRVFGRRVIVKALRVRITEWPVVQFYPNIPAAEGDGQ